MTRQEWVTGLRLKEVNSYSGIRAWNEEKNLPLSLRVNEAV